MKYKKKRLLKIFTSLEQINQIMEKSDKKVISSMKEALGQCQSIAIEVGTELETMGEITLPIVKNLEDYCENIYQQSINPDRPEMCRKIAKKVRRQLWKIMDEINYIIPEDKKEVLFLPYKASMWDSLESVWMAARDDEGCDDYVVPIPYFDKNPDGSLGLMHDEGGQYPDYVPITDWREYSLEEHMPDVIYIHNPYDNCNYVTSVHPLFYARELKKYTDMLVYIPYFVGINNHVEPWFCVLPGTIYADRVIVESEEVREQYIAQIRKYEKESQCEGQLGNPEEKILALGSPKLDRVKKITRENVLIPDKWRPLLAREDGTRKKVVLYNTTIESTLRFGENALNKTEYVLRIFQENRDIVLLWRPHPLLLSTLRTMRPELYQKYSQTIEKYRKENWGIYDDTADIERAIALSDGYYGDWSSVVTLYQATGKPIMIQDYKA